VDLDQPADRIWVLVRDPAKVAGCIPNVRGFHARGGELSFEATIEDRLGPFKIEVPVTIDVVEDGSVRRMTAHIAGNDRRGQARVRGDVAATVEPTDTGGRVDLTSNIEVLGRLAALGAVPMRRRADQIFDIFVHNLSELLRVSARADD
jgi:carbon monoxide dehydrogenase subunit G